MSAGNQLEQRAHRLVELLAVHAPPELVAPAVLLVLQAGIVQMPAHLGPSLTQWMAQSLCRDLGVCPECQENLLVSDCPRCNAATYNE